MIILSIFLITSIILNVIQFAKIRQKKATQVSEAVITTKRSVGGAPRRHK
jgi:hypothetical protein